VAVRVGGDLGAGLGGGMGYVRGTQDRSLWASFQVRVAPGICVLFHLRANVASRIYQKRRRRGIMSILGLLLLSSATH
jgi:hypothetical protein